MWNLECGTSSPQTRRGMGLIEVLVAAAIIALIIAGISSLHRLLIVSSREVIRGTQAALLAEEGLEAARVLRDEAWLNIGSLTDGTAYTLAWTGSAWSTTTVPALVDGIFDRRITVSHVYRDSNDDIAASGTLDPHTYRVDATVSWLSGSATTSRTMSTYIGEIF